MAHQATPEATTGRRQRRRRWVQGCAPPGPLESPFFPGTAPPAPGRRTEAACPGVLDPPHQQPHVSQCMGGTQVLSSAARSPPPCMLRSADLATLARGPDALQVCCHVVSVGHLGRTRDRVLIRQVRPQTAPSRPRHGQHTLPHLLPLQALRLGAAHHPGSWLPWLPFDRGSCRRPMQMTVRLCRTASQGQPATVPWGRTPPAVRKISNRQAISQSPKELPINNLSSDRGSGRSCHDLRY